MPRYKEEMKWLPLAETPKGAGWEIYSGNATHNDWRRPANPKIRARLAVQKRRAYLKEEQRKADAKPTIMDRTRAAVGYLNARGGYSDNEAMKLKAFMAIFHPGESV